MQCGADIELYFVWGGAAQLQSPAAGSSSTHFYLLDSKIKYLTWFSDTRCQFLYLLLEDSFHLCVPVQPSVTAEGVGEARERNLLPAALAAPALRAAAVPALAAAVAAPGCEGGRHCSWMLVTVIFCRAD